MWLRRLAALAAAVALVAGAFALRDRRQRSSATPTTPTTPGAGGSTDATAAKGFTLVCAIELQALCTDLGKDVTVRIESVSTTAAAFANAAEPRTIATAWLTVDPWPGLSDLGRADRGTAFAAATTIANSPVGVAVRTPRNARLAAACGGKVTLTCVGDKGGASWTDLGGDASWQVLKPTILDPTATLYGPASLAAAVREQRKDQGLTLIELQSDDAFVRWQRNFLRSASGTDALAQAVLQPVYDAVVVPQIEFAATAAPSGKFAFEGQSAYAATLVVAPVAGTNVPKAVADALAANAVKAGWVAGAALSPSLDANLVAGLQRVWRENA